MALQAALADLLVVRVESVTPQQREWLSAALEEEAVGESEEGRLPVNLPATEASMVAVAVAEVLAQMDPPGTLPGRAATAPMGLSLSSLTFNHV